MSARTGVRRSGIAAAMALILLGCGGQDEGWSSPVPFDTSYVTFSMEQGAVGLFVEVAATSRQREYGLMGRPSLDSEWGMLFTYDSVQSPDQGFWMWRTRMPLDIAFIAADGSISAIRSMPPCESPDPQWCPSYEAGVEYTAAVEVNEGWFQANGVGPGSRMELQSEPGPEK